MSTVKSSTGIPVIMPSPEQLKARQRSARARDRVLEKLRGGKGIHATAFSVLERTELRGMERDGLIGYHPGLSKWFDAVSLARQLEQGAAEANAKAAAAEAAVPAAVTFAAQLTRAPVPDTECPICHEWWVSMQGATTTECTKCVRERHRTDTFELRRRGEDA